MFRPRIRTAAVALVSLTALGTTLVPGAAFAESEPADLRPRLERVCLRIANIEIRTEKLITRLQGDVSVIGSLAWLEAAADRAEAAGRTDLAEVLRNRLRVRSQTLEILQDRLDDVLPRLRAACADHGVEL